MKQTGHLVQLVLDGASTACHVLSEGDRASLTRYVKELLEGKLWDSLELIRVERAGDAGGLALPLRITVKGPLDTSAFALAYIMDLLEKHSTDMAMFVKLLDWNEFKNVGVDVQAYDPDALPEEDEVADARREWPLPSATSGAMYRGVQATPYRRSASSTTLAANPKSNSFRTPHASNPMLAGFRSRNTMFLECRYDRASAREHATRSLLNIGAVLEILLVAAESLQRAMRSSSVSCNRSNSMKYPSLRREEPQTARPWMPMMLGWSRLASMGVSWTRSSTPMRNCSSFDCIWGRRHFMAYFTCVFWAERAHA